MADLTNASTQTPAAAPPAAVEAPSTPATPEVPAFAANLDNAHFDAKLAAFRSAVAAPAAEAAAASEKPAPDAPVATPTPAAPASPEGAQAPQSASETPTQFLERLARAENERDQLTRQLAEVAPKAQTAAQIEAALKADPIKFLVDRGVTQDALREFLLHGPKKPDPALVAAEETAKAALAKVEAVEAAQAEREASANIARFKSEQVAPSVVADKFPLLLAVHGDQAVEQVYAVMNSAYQAGQNMSAEQAAAKLEGVLSALEAKISGGKKPAAPAVAAPPTAPKQRITELTNGPTGAEVGEAPAGHYDPSQDDARLARAAELMRRRRMAG